MTDMDDYLFQLWDAASEILMRLERADEDLGALSKTNPSNEDLASVALAVTRAVNRLSRFCSHLRDQLQPKEVTP